MPIYDIFSKRQKRLRGEMPDVYTYDDIPQALRIQIIHIIIDSFGFDLHPITNNAEMMYKELHDILCREYGLFVLTQDSSSYKESVFNYFLSCKDIERELDLIEMSFRVISSVIATNYRYQSDTHPKLSAESAVEELNYRFKEHGIGYEFQSGQIIRIDSQFVHSEAIKPVLHLLSDPIYKGANEEFLKAHEHYRNHRNKECLVDALKSMESVIKAICTKRHWAYNQTDTSKTLINICFEKGLIPDYLQSQFSSLRSLLESGTPTVRNKLGGHGQGTETVQVPDEISRYALNLTASNILLLIEAEKNFK